MSRPRQVLPNSFYLITRRCTQRQFLLRPDEETNNAYLYCLIEAAQRFSIELVMMCAMSNHHHTIVFDHCAPRTESYLARIARQQRGDGHARVRPEQGRLEEDGIAAGERHP